MGLIDVSIIVPIRNGEKYIPSCVEFIKQQTCKDFEVIFVIDAASSDHTSDMISKALSEFDNARLVIQEDGLGLGGNRNLGLRNATGAYVWFLDVDDAPSPDFVRDMLRLIRETGSDFVCCNFINSSPTGIVKESSGANYHTKVMGHDEALLSRNNEEFPVSSWSKLFNREFLFKNELFFDESYAEDIIHTYRCVDVCSRICIYDRPLYAYRQTKGSICRNKANLDKRGQDEIASYDRVDMLTEDPVILRRNALMKIRSSGHMSYSGFMKFAKSQKNRDSYEKYLKGTFEGWWHLHLSTLYWIALRTYVAVVYKRNGTKAMNKKFW